MRIVNVTASRRHFSYAATSSGGVDLDPGQEGPEISITRLFETPLIFKEVDAGVCMLRLSTEDRELLNRVLKEGERKVVVAKLPPKPPKPAKKPKAQPKRPKPTPQKSAIPTWNTKPEEPAVTDEMVESGGVSLAQLQGKNARLRNIEQHMSGPMSR